MHRLKMQNSRWGNSGSGKVQTDQQISVIKTNNNPATFYSNASGCRLSLDGGTLDRRESSSSSTLTDDSVIMSRIRKSCEQKEEFLRNTATPLYSQIIAREFYARPQKFQKQIWPPNSPPPPPSEVDYLKKKSTDGFFQDEEDDEDFVREYELENGKGIIYLVQKEKGDVHCVVWDAALVLGKYLEKICCSGKNFLTGKNIIELGSGLGCVGMVAAFYG